MAKQSRLDQWMVIYKAWKSSGLLRNRFYHERLQAFCSVTFPFPSRSTFFHYINQISAAQQAETPDQPKANEVKVSTTTSIKRPGVEVTELADNLRLAKLSLDTIEEAEVRHIKTVRYPPEPQGRPVRLSLPNGAVLEFLSKNPEELALHIFTMSPGVPA